MQNDSKIDWVELGCRGWDLEPEGAGMDCDWQEERCHEDDYAHVDRKTLSLLCHGCPKFVAGVMNDLLAAGYVLAKGPEAVRLLNFQPTESTSTMHTPMMIRWDCGVA